MDKVFILICGTVGLVITWAVIPYLRRLVLREGVSARQFHHGHKTVISRLGGVAIVAGFVAVVCIVLPFYHNHLDHDLPLILGALATFGLGFWDDLKPVGAKKKLFGQILIASAVYFMGLKIETFKNPINDYVWQLGSLSYFATVIWLVTLTNLINLIDGIDGLAGGISLMMMALLIYVSLQDHTIVLFLAVGMLGSLLGFLYYNFPPAKIYMGDGGAYFLGFLVGAMTIHTSQKGAVAAALIAPIFALALPIIDVAIAIARRGLKGLPIFRPDRKHIHHRLVDFGFSRVRTVLTLYAMSLIFLLLAFGILWSHGKWLPILFGGMCMILLLAAGSMQFTRDWFAVGRVLGNSLDMRKETRYVLVLAQWLQMEAERCDSIENLWADYKFVLKKIGFCQARLILSTGEKNWQSSLRLQEEEMLHSHHALHIGEISGLDLKAHQSVMDPQLFELMSELAAEAFMKAARKWEEIHELPIHFDSKVSAEILKSRLKRARAYLPA
ncbi:MAG: hypothetical protein JWN25_2179 [Verrucomicrobiales bacterium]|jgi:UDP-GlcNAc:undecaprenyl-phosphate GlcNAc-1-phosphate transferase|nr:hypothetical protein [Verrucomicrobiales bacterium]MDB6130232.1 hypothetical protein [Verrucomicrobiales bacterium]